MAELTTTRRHTQSQLRGGRWGWGGRAGSRGGVGHRCDIAGGGAAAATVADFEPLVGEAALHVALLGVDGDVRIVGVQVQGVGSRCGSGRNVAHHGEGDGGAVGAGVLGVEAHPALGGAQGGAGDGVHPGDGEAARGGGGGGRRVARSAEGTVWRPLPEARPVRLKLAEVCPAATLRVVEAEPSVMVSELATALVKLRVPARVYWLVAELQLPGVTLRASEGWALGLGWSSRKPGRCRWWRQASSPLR